MTAEYAIMIHPEYEELLEALKTLREKLSLLFLGRDELLSQECKNIEAEYMIKIGALEYKSFELECRVRRIQRKIELIRAKLNRGEGVVLTEIEARLDAEYAEYAEKLRVLTRALDDAFLRRNAKALSLKATMELKRLYRQIVKCLHPDLNPRVGEQEKKWFTNAMETYKNGDLPAMKTLWLLLADNVSSDENAFEECDSLEEMRARRDFLQNRHDALIQEIKTIKSSFPYNQKDFLRDEEKVAARAEELNGLAERHRQAYSEYERKLNAILAP